MASTRVTRRTVLGSVGAASLAPALTATDAAARVRAEAAWPAESAAPHPHLAFAAQLQLAMHAGTSQTGAHWAAITGGEAAGPRLSGRVQGGRIDWRCDASGATQVMLCIAVQGADGSIVEVRDRGICAGPGLHAGAAISTAPQLFGAAGELPDAPAVLVGRLDTTQLDQGVLRLLAFEVS